MTVVTCFCYSVTMASKTSSDRQRASNLLSIYRGETDDFFKLWPPDKQYFFSSDAKAFVAYAVKRKAAVCMGDPVGRGKSIQRLLQEFKQFCAAHGWLIVFIQATGKYQEAYASIGLRSILIGADAVIRLDHFVRHTARDKYFRNIVNRFEKHAFTVHKHAPPHPKALMSEVRAISNSWLKLPHRKEWSFLTGRLNDDYLQQVPLYVLRDKQGQAQAFTNGLPSYKPGVATIDLMRHRQDAPNNSIDYLFVRLLQALHEEGYGRFNLGMSPLDGHPLPADHSARWLIRLYKLSNRFIGFKGLHQFKAKYEPEWEPRYVWYQGRAYRLPQLGLAVLSLMESKKR